MAGYGTVDAEDQMAWQLTFPHLFSKAYPYGGFSYKPSVTVIEHLPEGMDFQAQYHRQKQMEANRSVMNGVRDTRRSTNRALVSRYGYFGMPTPVLSQRRFANPTEGAMAFHSARRDVFSNSAPYHLVEGESLSGGVLRSAMGQQFGRDRLKARIGELNRIDANQFPTDEMMMGLQPQSMGLPPQMMGRTSAAISPPLATSGALSESTKIEFNLLRQRVIDALESGFTNTVTLGEIGRLIQLLFRYVPTATDDELDDLWEGFTGNGGLLQLITQLNDDDYDPPNESEYNEQVALSMYTLLFKAKDYLEAMIGGTNLSPKEKIDLSKSLVKSLKFGSIIRKTNTTPEEALVSARKDGALTAREEQQLDNIDGDDADFDRPAAPREDYSMAGRMDNPRQYLDTDTRQYFGNQSGAFLGEEGPSPSQTATERLAQNEIADEESVPEDERLQRLQEQPSSPPKARRKLRPQPPPPTVRKPKTPEGEPEEVSGPQKYSVALIDRLSAQQLKSVIVSKYVLDRLTENSRRGYEALGKKLGIQVYAKSSVPNVRKNFIKRLDLVGK
jgi:hypothetical protein